MYKLISKIFHHSETICINKVNISNNYKSVSLYGFLNNQLLQEHFFKYMKAVKKIDFIFKENSCLIENKNFFFSLKYQKYIIPKQILNQLKIIFANNGYLLSKIFIKRKCFYFQYENNLTNKEKISLLLLILILFFSFIFLKNNSINYFEKSKLVALKLAQFKESRNKEIIDSNRFKFDLINKFLLLPGIINSLQIKGNELNYSAFIKKEAVAEWQNKYQQVFTENFLPSSLEFFTINDNFIKVILKAHDNFDL